MAALKKPRLKFSFVHEIGIAQNILEHVLAGAEKENAHFIHRIQLRVGTLAGVVEEALQFALEVAVKGTVAQDAAICIERVQALCLCSTCQKTFEPSDIIFICPSCGTFSSKILKGRELEVVELEIT